jgi:hypothetical protein
VANVKGMGAGSVSTFAFLDCAKEKIDARKKTIDKTVLLMLQI